MADLHDDCARGQICTPIHIELQMDHRIHGGGRPLQLIAIKNIFVEDNPVPTPDLGHRDLHDGVELVPKHRQNRFST
jgi:hypothetical protein